jgi:hypothetical protein
MAKSNSPNVAANKAAILPPISIVLHSSNTTDAGKFCDGGTALIVGVDISANRALDLFQAHQCSNTEEQAKADFDLGAALETLKLAEDFAAEESAKVEAAITEALTDGELKNDMAGDAAKLLAAGQALNADPEAARLAAEQSLANVAT